MGGGYSDLYVYFNSKTDKPYGTEYTVTPTQENFKQCIDFEKITHTITFKQPDDQLYYNVILYDGSTYASKGNRIFGYYYPRDNNQVVQQVHVYYSVLAPNNPLVISFKTKINTYDCSVDKLLSAGWDRAYYIDGYSLDSSLSKEILVKEFKKHSRNRKIQFRIEKTKTDISGYKQELGDDKSYRFIFIPSGEKSVLSSEYLFAIDYIKNEPKALGDPKPEVPRDCKRVVIYRYCRKKNKSEKDCKNDLNSLVSRKTLSVNIKHKNKIDEYFLRPFDGKIYDGIIVYLVREDNQKAPGTMCRHNLDNKNDALLLEFIESSKPKTCLLRKDKEGFWWSLERVDYSTYKELSEKLSKIKQDLKQDVVTVILDEKRQYNGLERFEEGKKDKACTKYTHTFNTAKDPILLFERQQREIIKGAKPKAKIVEVYYLRPKDAEEEDNEPFLIVFDQDGDEKNKKAYHFANKYGFEEWVEFAFYDETKKEDLKDLDLVKKLYERVGNIENYGSCITDLKLLRSYAHDILTGKDPPTPVEKEETVPQRPQPKDPPTVAKDQYLEIILGSVGGVVGLVSMIGGYGIYWYNTTIKLLT